MMSVRDDNDDEWYFLSQLKGQLYRLKMVSFSSKQNLKNERVYLLH